MVTNRKGKTFSRYINLCSIEAGSETILNVAALLIQSTVSLEKKTDEGYVIKLIAPAWEKVIELIQKDHKVIYAIPPRTWEELIAGAYDKAGFDEVTLTPRTGDHGRDVIAVKRGFGSVRIIDEVKAYKPGHLVKAVDVRALVGVLSSDLGATKGIVTTTSDFAPKIREDKSIGPLIPYRLELINGKDLIKYLAKLLSENSH